MNLLPALSPGVITGPGIATLQRVAGVVEPQAAHLFPGAVAGLTTLAEDGRDVALKVG